MADRWKLGIDLGGTKTEGVVLDPRGRETFRKRIPTRQDLGYRQVLAGIGSLYVEMKSAAKGRAHTLGIGTPGSISRRTGDLRNANTLCLNGKPFKRDVAKLLGRVPALHNDANCFALAEARLGAGRGRRVVFGVILGTGCGGGIVIDGRVHDGLQGLAGEWGHTSIDPHGTKCYCGRRGCVETYISGGGLETRYRKRFRSRLRLEAVVDAYRGGDRRAAGLMKEFFEAYGRALANLINVLDPDVVVLGGGLSNIEELYAAGAAAVRRHVFTKDLETPIVRNALGDSAGVLGAALLGV
ncbi:MAG: ROK family protein [Elusimicrobia bacterium]|nr:ROK family protein [Elusimicrobiota bacterium]